MIGRDILHWCCNNVSAPVSVCYDGPRIDTGLVGRHSYR